MATVMKVAYGHNNGVTCAVFSPDGKKVVTTSVDKTVRIWETNTGKTLRILSGHSGSVTSAVFSPDSSLVITTSEDRTTRIWGSENGECKYIFHEIHGVFINGVDFRTISSASGLTDKQIEIFRQYGAII